MLGLDGDSVNALPKMKPLAGFVFTIPWREATPCRTPGLAASPRYIISALASDCPAGRKLSLFSTSGKPVFVAKSPVFRLRYCPDMR
jgi:hypothetical protein